MKRDVYTGFRVCIRQCNDDFQGGGYLGSQGSRIGSKILNAGKFGYRFVPRNGPVCVPLTIIICNAELRLTQIDIPF
jgi:hypothetical protein